MPLMVYVNQSEPALPGSIPHTTYIFSEESDGSIRNQEPIVNLQWDQSAVVYFDSNLVAESEYNEGINITHSNVLQVPIAGSPANATGNYRTHLYVVAQTSSNPGPTPGVDFTRGKIEMFTNDSHHFENDTYYTYTEQWGGGSGTTAYPRHVMYAQEGAPYDFSEFGGEDYYYSGDNEDVYMNFQVYSYAGTTSPAYTRTELLQASLWNEAEYNAGGGDFEGCRDDTTGNYVQSGSTTGSTVFGALYYSGNIEMWRGFFEFDFSVLSSGTRQMTSSSVNVAGVSYSDSSVVAVVGTQADILTTADYDAFSGQAITSVAAWEHIGNVYNVMTFNSTGKTYVDGHFTAGTAAKLCLREYDHDYLNVSPGYSVDYRNGCVFADHSSDLCPYIKVVYNKVPEYTDASEESDWNIDTGTWNGSGWDSNGTGLQLSGWGKAWIADERFAGIRLTFTGVSSLDLTVHSNGNYLIVDDESITSGQLVSLRQWGHWDNSNADFDEIQLTSSGASYTLTKIEFLEA